LVMTDICPHSLGVEVSKQHGKIHDAGYFTPIIDRNVTIPTSQVDRFNTIHPEQDRIDLKIYQGESRRVEENTLLGNLEIKGLKARPGQRHAGEIDVRFSFDTNGILEVEVTVLAS